MRAALAAVQDISARLTVQAAIAGPGCPNCTVVARSCCPTRPPLSLRPPPLVTRPPLVTPQVNMRGDLPDTYRQRHPTAPKTVQWWSGVLLPAGVKPTNGTWGPRWVGRALS